MMDHMQFWHGRFINSFILHLQLYILEKRPWSHSHIHSLEACHASLLFGILTMPRSLPWMQTAAPGNKSTNPSKTSSRTQRPAKRPRQEDTEDEPNHTGVSLQSRRLQGRGSRTPSTSPPPIPPVQELMKPSDEDWIMVEDELYAVAQTFTKHLHWSEYKRLKERASQRGTDIAIIDRPTDGITKLSKQLKMQKKHEARRADMEELSHNIRAKEQALLGKGETKEDEDSDNDDDVAIGDRNLAGLMFGTGGSRIPKRTILHGALKSSKSQAAAGFEKQSPAKSRASSSLRTYDIPGMNLEEVVRFETRKEASPIKDKDYSEEDDDEDDLDLPVIRKPKVNFVVPETKGSSSPLMAPPVTDKGISKSSFQKVLPSARVTSTSTLASTGGPLILKPKIKQELDEKPLNFDGLPRSKAATTGILDRAKARAVMKQSKEEKTIKLEEIPTFLV